MRSNVDLTIRTPFRHHYWKISYRRKICSMKKVSHHDTSSVSKKNKIKKNKKHQKCELYMLNKPVSLIGALGSATFSQRLSLWGEPALFSQSYPSISIFISPVASSDIGWGDWADWMLIPFGSWRQKISHQHFWKDDLDNIESNENYQKFHCHSQDKPS